MALNVRGLVAIRVGLPLLRYVWHVILLTVYTNLRALETILRTLTIKLGQAQAYTQNTRKCSQS